MPRDLNLMIPLRATDVHVPPPTILMQLLPVNLRFLSNAPSSNLESVFLAELLWTWTDESDNVGVWTGRRIPRARKLWMKLRGPKQCKTWLTNVFPSKATATRTERCFLKLIFLFLEANCGFYQGFFCRIKQTLQVLKVSGKDFHSFVDNAVLLAFL